MINFGASISSSGAPCAFLEYKNLLMKRWSCAVWGEFSKAVALRGSGFEVHVTFPLPMAAGRAWECVTFVEEHLWGGNLSPLLSQFLSKVNPVSAVFPMGPALIVYPREWLTALCPRVPFPLPPCPLCSLPYPNCCCPSAAAHGQFSSVSLNSSHFPYPNGSVRKSLTAGKAWECGTDRLCFWFSCQAGGGTGAVREWELLGWIALRHQK